jgi:hypothetical protein
VRWRLLIVAAAAGALLVPLPPALIERYYSAGIFARLQPVLTSLSNRAPFAVFDLFVATAVAALLVLTVRDITRSCAWWRRAARVTLRLVTTAAVVYLVFLVTWGFNYRRLSLRAKVPFSAARVSPEAALALGRETVARLNALHAPAHARGWAEPGVVDPRLADAFRSAVTRVGGSPATEPARPKRTMFDLYFRRAGVSGMTDPFFLETLVPGTLLPFERAFVVAHEWSHLGGFTDEGEANFVGWLACLRGEESHQYSGWLSLYGEVMAALPREARAGVMESLAPGPRADLAAVRARMEREISPRLSTAGWMVYDQYLKANHIDAGTASYAEVVQLILGTDLR